MKICPRCQKTYSDENLNFCLEDGSILEQLGQTATIQMNQPRMTQPQSGPRPSAGPEEPWRTPQPHSPPPSKKSSKAWVWVLLILGAVVLLCGGGFIGLLAFIGSQANNAANLTSGNNRPAPGQSNSALSNSSLNSSPSSREDLTEIDLEIFVKEFSPYGTTEIKDDELIMGSKQKRFYYVLVAPDDYQTDRADTKVTLRNIDNASGSLGYGLIFHSDPTPLQQGYAFLIDTKKRKYRVVNHTPKKESTVITWTTSDAIMEGAAENTLEVRDLDEKIELYINGKMVNSVRNAHGYPRGVVGLYAGDGVKVAFKDLEIRK